MTDQTQQDLERDIERTRADLGDTVEALAYKTDVKARASEQIEERTRAARDNPTPIIGAAIAAGLLALFLLRRKS